MPRPSIPAELLPLFEHLQALGMEPAASAAGLVATAHFKKLVNAFTHAAIFTAQVKNFGVDRVLFSDPAHLSHLPAVRILGFATPDDYEGEVHRLYHRRLQKMHDASEFLRKRRMKIVIDERGFRVVGVVSVGHREVRFTLREGLMAQILSIGGSSLEKLVDPRERRMDVRTAATSSELEMMLEPLVTSLAARVATAEAPTDSHKAAIGMPAPAGEDVDRSGPIPRFDYGGGELTDPGAEQSQPGARPNIPLGEDDSGELIGLVCDTCGSFYLVDPATPDYRLLKTCPRCLGGV
ncbi:MAG TPA: hypothetical protein VMV18_08150 [bacterium]|nr:hypothetical protein [bacterium]